MLFFSYTITSVLVHLSSIILIKPSHVPTYHSFLIFPPLSIVPDFLYFKSGFQLFILSFIKSSYLSLFSLFLHVFVFVSSFHCLLPLYLLISLFLSSPVKLLLCCPSLSNPTHQYFRFSSISPLYLLISLSSPSLSSHFTVSFLSKLWNISCLCYLYLPNLHYHYFRYVSISPSLSPRFAVSFLSKQWNFSCLCCPYLSNLLYVVLNYLIFLCAIIFTISHVPVFITSSWSPSSNKIPLLHAVKSSHVTLFFLFLLFVSTSLPPRLPLLAMKFPRAFHQAFRSEWHGCA